MIKTYLLKSSGDAKHREVGMHPNEPNEHFQNHHNHIKQTKMDEKQTKNE